MGTAVQSKTNTSQDKDSKPSNSSLPGAKVDKAQEQKELGKKAKEPNVSTYVDDRVDGSRFIEKTVNDITIYTKLIKRNGEQVETFYENGKPKKEITTSSFRTTQSIVEYNSAGVIVKTYEKPLSNKEKEAPSTKKSQSTSVILKETTNQELPTAPSKSKEPSLLKNGEIGKIVVNLEKQIAGVYVYNSKTDQLELKKEFRVTTGAKHSDGGGPTPPGVYVIGAKDKDKHSTSYPIVDGKTPAERKVKGAPMPYALLLYTPGGSYTGLAIHVGVISQYLSKLSHGCIRTSRSNAKSIFDRVSVGVTQVEVTANEKFEPTTELEKLPKPKKVEPKKKSTS
jgi:lipoprotein-anchoring transpeptidase ErfK/SrfK